MVGRRTSPIQKALLNDYDINLASGGTDVVGGRTSRHDHGADRWRVGPAQARGAGQRSSQGKVRVAAAGARRSRHRASSLHAARAQGSHRFTRPCHRRRRSRHQGASGPIPRGHLVLGPGSRRRWDGRQVAHGRDRRLTWSSSATYTIWPPGRECPPATTRVSAAQKRTTAEGNRWLRATLGELACAPARTKRSNLSAGYRTLGCPAWPQPLSRGRGPQDTDHRLRHRGVEERRALP